MSCSVKVLGSCCMGLEFSRLRIVTMLELVKGELKFAFACGLVAADMFVIQRQRLDGFGVRWHRRSFHRFCDVLLPLLDDVWVCHGLVWLKVKRNARW